MLSRLRICAVQARSVSCTIRRHSSVPKLHDILQYWHKMKTDGATPNSTAPGYRDKVRVRKARPNSKEAPFLTRSWSIQWGVMKTARGHFYMRHRNCDTVFDRNVDFSKIDFKKRLGDCEGEKDRTDLEYEIAASANNYNLRELLYFMDGFLYHQHKPKKLLSVTCNNMVYQFSREEKTISRVLHFVYIIGCSRNIPKELLGEIEQYIVQHIHELTFSDLSLFAFTSMVTNEPIIHYSILTAMAESTLKHFRGKRFCSNDDFIRLSGMYKCFTHSRYFELNFYLEMADMLVRFVPEIRYFRTPQFMAILRSYAAAGVKHQKLFKVLRDQIDVSTIFEKSDGLTKSRGTRCKDINRVIWAYGSLGEPVDKVWIDTLIALLSEEDLVKSYPHGFVEGLAALAMFNVSPMNLYRKLYDPDVLRDIQTTIHGEALDFYQLRLLHQYIRVMHPEFKTTNNFQKMFKDRRQFHDKLERSMVLKKGLIHYWRILTDILGPKQVTLKYLINVSAVLDIVIYLDENNQPIPQLNQYDSDTQEVIDNMAQYQQEYVKNESHKSLISIVAETHTQSGQPFDWYSTMQSIPHRHILPESLQEKRKICIRVFGSNQCFMNYPEIFGNLSIENRIIHKMGYELVIVGPREARDIKHMSPEEKRQCIYEEILKPLNIQVDKKQLVKPSNQRTEERPSGLDIHDLLN